MLDVRYDTQRGVTLHGTTPELVKRLRPVAQQHNLRWLAKGGFWFVPGSRSWHPTQGERVATQLRDALADAGLLQSSFGQLVKGRKSREKREKREGRRPPKGKGYTPIPKSTSGGYRRKQGGKWVYWYPGIGFTKTRESDPTTALDKVAAAGQRAAKAFTDLGKFFTQKKIGLPDMTKKLHHYQDDIEHFVTAMKGVDLTHLTEMATAFAFSEDHDTDDELNKAE